MLKRLRHQPADTIVSALVKFMNLPTPMRLVLRTSATPRWASADGPFASSGWASRARIPARTRRPTPDRPAESESTALKSPAQHLQSDALPALGRRRGQDCQTECGQPIGSVLRGRFLTGRIICPQRVADIFGRVPAEGRRWVLMSPGYEKCFVQCLSGRQRCGVLAAAAWRRRISPRNGRQAIEKMLMTLSEEKTERGGLDLVVLPRCVAHKRAPQVGASAISTIRHKLEDFFCRFHRIIEVALRLRAVLCALRKVVIGRERRRSFRGDSADSHWGFRLCQNQ